MEDELYLLKKQKKKGPLSFLFSRTGVILSLFLVTVVLFLVVIIFFAEMIFVLLRGVTLFNIIVVISIINSDMDSSAKVVWMVIVGLTSIFGTIFYLFTKIDIGSRSVGDGYNWFIKNHREDIKQDEETLKTLKEESPETEALAKYLNRDATYPISRYNDITYYPLGENKWEAMLEELEKAEDFIFMEYFIIKEGKMWGKILKILKEKAEQGVDVRVLYDGTCAFSMLPYSYPKMLRKIGIQCKMFSPLRPFVSTHYNFRDHRKILVIDGKVGFNGGVNLGDEYINVEHPFGHWKDTAIRVKGEAVKSLTLMFLNMWALGEDDVDYERFINVPVDSYPEKKGYAMPYGCNPFAKNKIGEKVYMDILNRANEYVHIMTPYLILDDGFLTSLKYAAERGVDVKLILPGVPDKSAVYALAKTYFQTLIDSGVKIYLYTPGFVHAKVFTSDDKKAVVGTINLDYRSLYHHFECGTYLYDCDCIAEIEKDYEETLKQCQRVTNESIKAEPLKTKLLGKVVKVFAPLL